MLAALSHAPRPGRATGAAAVSGGGQIGLQALPQKYLWAGGGHRDVCPPAGWTPELSWTPFGMLGSCCGGVCLGWVPLSSGGLPDPDKLPAAGRAPSRTALLTVPPSPSGLASSGNKPALRAKTAIHILPLFCFTQKEQGSGTSDPGSRAGCGAPGDRGI